MTLAAQMVSLAFGRLDAAQRFIEIALPSLFFLSLITLPACYLGIVLGRQIGLGVNQLDALFTHRPDAWRRLRNDLVFATVLGFLVGAALLTLRLFTAPFLPPELPQLGFRGVVGGLAVSLGAAVAEEVWFRLGLMTLVVWSLARLMHTRAPSPTVIWSVIVFSALAFAAAHLPQVVAYGAASPIGVVGTLFGNVLVGTFFGWMFWQRGILAAMAAHFSVDLVLHVVSVAVW